MACQSFCSLSTLSPLYLIYTTLRVPALEHQTRTDPKTGLYNARYFTDMLESELSRANRFRRPLTIVMADVDHLRNINNTYGHLAGDIVLRMLSEQLGQHVKEFDIVGRFGGEEFAILLPETSLQQALPRIEEDWYPHRSDEGRSFDQRCADHCDHEFWHCRA